MTIAKILIDADVIIHFYRGEQLDNFDKIFIQKIYLLDKVLSEIKFNTIKIAINKLIESDRIILMDFPEDNEEIKKEYFYIKNKLVRGDGESACMAVAKYTKDIIASSNLKDIKQYCERHNIVYLTTCDFIYKAYKESILSAEQCNSFITDVLKKGSKLPYNDFQELLNHYTSKNHNLNPLL